MNQSFHSNQFWQQSSLRFVKEIRMSQPVQQLVSSLKSLSRSRELDSAAIHLENATPIEIMEWAFNEFGEKVTIATGFGAEGVAMIDMAVTINPNPNIFYIDTDFLFDETYELRRRLEERYGVEIRAFNSELTPEAQADVYGPRLWTTNPDLCCNLRKIEPLKQALNGREAWITAIRRDQTAARANALAVEWDSQWNLIKVNPLIRWTKRDVWNYIVKNGVPYNPLHDAGYPSIGCTHCTRAVRPGEDDRAGRWAGLTKTECGLHAAPETGIELQGATFAV